ncbi:MAG: ATP-dependent dethiobiotin synthetase BioD [Pseudomonadota bacterium]
MSPKPKTPGCTGYFIVGTDTGVGKTTVTAALLAAARIRGLRPAPLKPAETGCARAPDGTLIPADGSLLRQAAGIDDYPFDEIIPYRYSMPAAPGVAARYEGRPFSLDRILATRDRLVSLGHTVLFVEGAGGLLVPYGEATRPQPRTKPITRDEGQRRTSQTNLASPHSSAAAQPDNTARRASDKVLGRQQPSVDSQKHQKRGQSGAIDCRASTMNGARRLRRDPDTARLPCTNATHDPSTTARSEIAETAITTADIAALLGLPLIIVARASLGTINHTLLTLAEARRRDLPVAGIILNRVVSARGPDEDDNPTEIARLGNIRVLGTIPHLTPAQRQQMNALAAVAERALDLDVLFAPAGTCQSVINHGS